MLTFTALSPTSFKLQNGDATLTVFPDGGKAPKDGITLVALPEEKETAGVISWPGEYNMGGVSVRGIGHEDGKQVSYVADPEHIRCAFLSDPVKDWTDKQIEAVGDIDVMVMTAADVKLTQKLVDEFDPRVLILLPGKDKEALKSVEKVIGVKQRVSEYKIKGSLPQEGRDVVVLA
ncbi:MAG: hypothetical protein HOO67_02845 [Candidatus Peribacteraceae bacterium]|nr:hypothetical protein [Candidatus Peribacteraceae bacterium]